MTVDFEPAVRDDQRLMAFAIDASAVLRSVIGRRDSGIHVAWRGGTDPGVRLTVTLTVAGAAESRLEFSDHDLVAGPNELRARLLAKLRDGCGGLVGDSRRW